jgi:hypothetical protein
LARLALAVVLQAPPATEYIPITGDGLPGPADWQLASALERQLEHLDVTKGECRDRAMAQLDALPASFVLNLSQGVPGVQTSMFAEAAVADIEGALAWTGGDGDRFGCRENSRYGIFGILAHENNMATSLATSCCGPPPITFSISLFFIGSPKLNLDYLRVALLLT